MAAYSAYGRTFASDFIFDATSRTNSRGAPSVSLPVSTATQPIPLSDDSVSYCRTPRVVPISRAGCLIFNFLQIGQTATLMHVVLQRGRYGTIPLLRTSLLVR